MKNHKKRTTALLGTVVLWAVLTVLALLQSPYQDVMMPPQGWYWWWYPYEVNPEQRLQVLSGHLSDITLQPKQQRLWAVGEQGLILWSDDLGDRWQQVPWDLNRQQPVDRVNVALRSFEWISSAQAGPQADYAKDSKQWAIKNNQSVDTSIIDRLQPETLVPVLPLLRAVYFGDEQHGWILGDPSRMLKTDDGGLSWQAVRAPESSLLDIVFVNPKTGYLVTGTGRVYWSQSGGEQWQLLSKDRLPMEGHWVKNAREWYWQSTDQGQFFWNRRGQRWQVKSQQAVKTPEVLAVKRGGFLRSTQFFRVTQEGVLQAGIKRGETISWSPVFLKPPLEQKPYHRYPAPWYWVFSLLVTGQLLYYLLRGRQTEIQTVSIADVLVSDRPLKPGDPDPLNFGRIARALSRFLRNPNTEPPMTIAITGEWGSGKSSLMNLLYHDLKHFGFMPVWFNAWHHQKGDQLLASLYAHMREQVPPSWKQFSQGVPIGLLFRAKLFWRRMQNNVLWYSLLIGLFVAAMTYLVQNPALLTMSLKLSSESMTFKQLIFSEDWQRGVLVALVGMAPPLALLVRGLQVFGVDPIRLMTVSSQRQKKEMPDPGARFTFAKEFAEVSDSLELGRMVIFIDDLDRCSQANVLEIMEVINFLSVSGRCYIVLGMADTWVKTCIALGFKELAAETHGDQENGGCQKLAQQNRIHFAEQYLEKLINIEVPVPTLQQSDLQALLMPPSDENAVLRQKKVGFKCWVSNSHQLLFAILAVILGGFLGSQLTQPDHFLNGLGISGQELTASILDLEEELQRSGADWEAVDRELPKKMQAPDALEMTVGLQDGIPSEEWFNPIRHLKSAVIWLGVVLLPALWGIWVRSPIRIEQDSQDFKRALAIWQPWIQWQYQTPRSVKRFLNRVRYLAMRSREGEGLHEADLVALSCIAALEPAWLRDNKTLHQLFESSEDLLLPWLKQSNYYRVSDQMLDEKEGETLVREWFDKLVSSLDQHSAAFKTDLMNLEELAQYAVLVTEVNV